MAGADRASKGGGVALVSQRRIADGGYADYARWLGRLAEHLRDWPGFHGQEVVPPTPPAQPDWVLIQHFARAEAARDWLRHADYGALLREVEGHFVGPEEVHLLSDGGPRPAAAASAVISYRVEPGQEAAFLAWQREIQRAEADFPGFLRHKIERPVPGLHEEWIIVLSFDSDEALTNWLQSDQRRRHLEGGRPFEPGFSLRRAGRGFDFWFRGPAAGERSGPLGILKSNLLVLLVLYPVVFLWSVFIGGPVLGGLGVPFWLALFIGNLVSTQLLGWWAVPKAFGWFGWWLVPEPGLWREIAGFALLAALYAASMAVYAAILGWNAG
ncbi:antibiotic biosynthesis monooxygenase [Ancylobacter lacus]|uniref:antibiotic biosynthesis monooxygenase n=1 Tax=Ancylobacter lacus TaxID=2579970 RepID=UPI001BCE8559|nr:antibiotic biosynthesis monooxygenase [Ancylobacter lacus]MBS7540761.1 antibiotic biosynthesis monooxygenase [Ancylobacter lacus]